MTTGPRLLLEGCRAAPVDEDDLAGDGLPGEEVAPVKGGAVHNVAGTAMSGDGVACPES